MITDKNKNEVNILEKNFIKYLDLNGKYVEWFWENGSELMQVNFGIPYENGLHTFQPDFIVKFADGTVGIFDTKASTEFKAIDGYDENTRVKAEALFKYVQDTNTGRNKNMKVIGGIVIEKNGNFYYNSSSEYTNYASNPSKWHPFEEILDNVRLALDLKTK